MGKGTIAGGGTDGLYQLTLDYGAAERDARVGDLTADLATLAPLTAGAQAAVDAAQFVENIRKGWALDATEAYIAAMRAVPAAQQAVDDAVQALSDLLSGSAPDPGDVEAAEAALTAANEALATARSDIEPRLQEYNDAAIDLKNAKVETALRRTTLVWYQAKAVQLTKDRAALTALVMTETVTAWCADLTEDASGEVATIEIPGENALVLIVPAAPGHTPASDGELVARELQRDTQVFWNAAVLPGWQKWMPTYRRGTITALDVDNDLAGVALEASDVSSAQGLDINQTATLDNVPVVYMTCNARAFEVGDRCVVKFIDQDWAQPRVVGFVDHPKACPLSLPRYIDVRYVLGTDPINWTGSRPWIWTIDGDGTTGITVINQLTGWQPVKIIIDYWFHSSSLIPPDDYLMSVVNTVVPYLPSSDCRFLGFTEWSGGGVPAGSVGTEHWVSKFTDGLIQVSETTYPVEVLTLPANTIEPIEYFTGGHYTGASTTTYGAEVPFDAYMTSKGAVPDVSILYNGIVYVYQLVDAYGGTDANYLRFELPGWVP